LPSWEKELSDILVVSVYHQAVTRLALSKSVDAISSDWEEGYTINQSTINRRVDVMRENKIQDFFDDGNEDTREANFKCKSPDTHLGCDLNSDVMG
jgi:RNase P/RNase MRP subunit p30